MKIKSLGIALLLSAGLCVAQNESDEEDPATDCKIALQLYSLRGDIDKDYNATIRGAGEAGYKQAEAANYSNGKFYGMTPADFKASLERAGIRALSSHVGRSLNEQELATGDFREALAWWGECIAAHKAAGMRYIVVPSMPVPKTLKDLQTYCEYYNQIGKLCRAQGISFGYHNHAFEFTKIEGQLMYDYLVEHTDPELVFFQMDVYWIVMAQQSPVDYFAKYPGRFKMLHIKDRRELGQSGMVGFDAIFRNVGMAGAQHAVVEVEQYSCPPLESVKKSLEYLKENGYDKF